MQFAAGLVRLPAVSKAVAGVRVVVGGGGGHGWGGGGWEGWVFDSVEFPNLKSCSGTHFSQS